ncbi:MAG: RNA-binding protein [Candidatus Aenigmarchaeota archaeon]|nr:RNA-binding protein [Candidatus Aenigmarchaeota archaeon]
MIMVKCISCGKDVSKGINFSKFKCPKCLEAEIVRCDRCKLLVNQYKCPKCGFVGP